jgi:toxin ParE1/3/4
MPQHYRVRMMPEASSDIARVFEHIERHSPQNAASVFEGLIDAIDSLSQFPHRYKVHRSARDPNRVVRSMPVAPFILYYRVQEQHRMVQVLTVRHAAQRQPRQF